MPVDVCRFSNVLYGSSFSHITRQFVAIPNFYLRKANGNSTLLDVTRPKF